MQVYAWREPVKESVGVKAGGCPRNPDFDIDGTENPSLIFRGGILAGHGGQSKTFMIEQAGGIG